MLDLLWLVEAVFISGMKHLSDLNLQKKAQAYDIQVRETQALEAQVREDQAREDQARKTQARKDYWQNFAYIAVSVAGSVAGMVGIFCYVRRNPDIIQKIQNIAKIGK